jgi:hypothetical protein
MLKFQGTTQEKLNYIKNIITERKQLQKWVEKRNQHIKENPYERFSNKLENKMKESIARIKEIDSILEDCLSL